MSERPGRDGLRVAAVQLNSRADFDANLAAADRLTRAAAADGARLVLLPEKWSVLGTGEDLRAGAQSLAGPAVVWARELARELAIDLVAGSICEPWRAAREHVGSCRPRRRDPCDLPQDPHV
jgi:predicted amidohydrolase